MKIPGKLMTALGAGAAAAVISLSLGFLNSVRFDKIAVRLLSFWVVTTGFVLLAGYLIDSFLLDTEEGEEGMPDNLTGHHVNILSPESHDDGAEGHPEFESFDEPDTPEGKRAVSSAGVLDAMDELPDLDILEGAYDDQDRTPEKRNDRGLDSLEPAVNRMAASSAVPDFGENNDPAEIARAVKTVLARDRE